MTTAPEGPGPLGKFDKVWQDFDEHYAFFELGKIDWDALRTKYRSRITAQSTERELAGIVGGMIGELRDYHADLHTPYGTFGAPPSGYARHYAPALLAASYFRDPLRQTSSGQLSYTRLADGIGYVHIASFVGSGWGNEMLQALAAMENPTALIIDIRNNGGGNEAIALEMASYIYDMPRTYRLTRFRSGAGHADFTSVSAMSAAPGRVHYPGPVALLTNRANGSSAEDFTLMLRILPSVVTVGDTTLGVGSNPLQVELSNGWTYRVPQSMQSTPDGFVYQWRGLPPSMPVAWTDADSVGGHDPYMDAAIRELQRRRSAAPGHAAGS